LKKDGKVLSFKQAEKYDRLGRFLLAVSQICFPDPAGVIG
jgi:hypothetical protein